MPEKRLAVLLRGALLASLFVALWVWLAALVRRFDPLIGAAPPAWLRPVGWLLAASGLALGMVCVALFLTTGRGTPAPFDPPKVFVASGPYRYVRNPMYVGAVLALLGGGLAVGSLAILILAALFWGLAHAMVVLNEEPALERRFGESFAGYRSRVRRWWPRLPGGRT
jgi:protein-S-isoprenylcysteine O-methyltransferase Ste14